MHVTILFNNIFLNVPLVGEQIVDGNDLLQLLLSVLMRIVFVVADQLLQERDVLFDPVPYFFVADWPVFFLSHDYLWHDVVWNQRKHTLITIKRKSVTISRNSVSINNFRQRLLFWNMLFTINHEVSQWKDISRMVHFSIIKMSIQIGLNFGRFFHEKHLPKFIKLYPWRRVWELFKILPRT